MTPEPSDTAGAATPPARPTEALAELVSVMDRLRSPGGCPWDAAQTHATLAPYALEEAYELVEAIESEDRTALREELGDLLLQVVFHARVAQEHPDDPFDVHEVAAGISAKLRRRHPHVFAETQVTGAADVSRRWDRIKQEEKGRASALDGIPVALPALARAQAVVSRADRAGLTVETEEGDSLGGALLGLVRRATQEGVDAEVALRDAVRSFERRARAAERLAQPPA